MFYDQAEIYVRSGDGGDGMIGFRREKFVSLGGPDGGDGGPGGDVILVVNGRMNSLARVRRQVHIRAGHGKHGGRKRMTGAKGESVYVEVPPGTVVRDKETGQLLADLTTDKQEFIAARGGRYGRGNIHFTTSRNQAPRLAERGEPGEERWLSLELKLIADVGIAGVPNAGKSTLLASVSGAQPKIAAYPFTTLIPHLGVVNLDDSFETMVLADIPGLIEGAAAGTGLGHDFLRHIERTRILIHLLDGAAADPLEDWAMINQELALYDAALEEKPQMVVLNKMDLPDAIAWEPLIAERMAAEKVPFMAISAVTRTGVRKMLYRVKEMLEALPPPLPVNEPIIIEPEEDPHEFTIQPEADGWRVSGKRIERVAAMTYWEFEATVMRFQTILEKEGISEALMEVGIEPGDMVYIGDEALEWSE